jgi:hypothetical protein|tara:strand:- start:1233 stop:1439 length:207 start_codon:yes stop_codon:yes gene_type:complete
MTNISWKNITLGHTVVNCGAYFLASLDDGETFTVTASPADWPTAKVRLAAISSSLEDLADAVEAERWA